MSAKTIIKICGIKDAETLDFTIAQGADMVGLNHFSKSPRFADLEMIAQLINRAKDKTASVVLLVNPDRKLIETMAALKPDFIQLHGSESPDLVSRIFQKLHTKVIKALPIGEVKDLENISQYVAAGATILLDAKPPKNATRPGGLGEVFDWNILDKIDPETSYLLSGGLTLANVSKAIKQLRPMGVDISSGVESAPGKKDFAKIKQFIANARNAEAS